MEVSKPNDFGTMQVGHEEIVARRGRWFAAVKVALCEDGVYRQSSSMMCSYGRHSSPVFLSTLGYRTVAEAIDAGLHELLRHWRTPFHSEPQSIHDELNDMRQQIETRLSQPMLV